MKKTEKNTCPVNTFQLIGLQWLFPWTSGIHASPLIIVRSVSDAGIRPSMISDINIPFMGYGSFCQDDLNVMTN